MEIKAYHVEIRETLARTVEILAENGEHATEQIRAIYKKEKIVLTADDFVMTEFEVV